MLDLPELPSLSLFVSVEASGHDIQLCRFAVEVSPCMSRSGKDGMLGRVQIQVMLWTKLPLGSTMLGAIMAISRSQKKDRFLVQQVRCARLDTGAALHLCWRLERLRCQHEYYRHHSQS